MNSAAVPPDPQTLIDIINRLLLATLTVRSFSGRWQLLRTKLTTLLSSLSSLTSSPSYSDNPLVQTLITNLDATLQTLTSLSSQCTNPNSAFSGKLHMQSDLDMASSSLSSHLHSLDLLLSSGVLNKSPSSSAIVLSQPNPNSSKDELHFFIRDLFTRLQIGGVEFKKKALESLLQLLLDDDKSATSVAREGNIRYLIHLMDTSHVGSTTTTTTSSSTSIREQAVTAVSILAAANDDSRKCVFEEGGLGPLLRVLEFGSNAVKEKAAIAVEAITADSENAWAVSAYGGVSILIEACRSGSPAVQAHAVGAIKSIADVEDIRTALAEEGAVPLLVQLLNPHYSTATIENTAKALSLLASNGEYFRALIIQERGLVKLMNLVQSSSSSDTLESALRAIAALSASDSVSRILSSSTSFVIRLGEFIKHGNSVLQHVSASLVAELSSLMSDGNKRAIAGCMGSLVKLMESPKPVGLQEIAAEALIGLLSVRSNRKELVRDEKSLMRIVNMLDPMNELVPRKFAVAVVAAIVGSGNEGCRKRLVAAGAYGHVQRLVELEVAGAKKVMQRLAGNRLKSIFSRNWRE